MMVSPGLPRIIVGTARMGSPVPNPLFTATDRERAFAEVDAIVELGCTAFDLAASYQAGGTERFFGRWLASRRNRDRLFLISKGGLPYPIVRRHRLSAGELTADLEASLRRLGTDRVDLYLLHRDDESEPLESLVRTMATFQKQGKIRAWGVSNWRHERILAVDAVARSAGLPRVAASSPHLSLARWVKAPFPGTASIAGPENADARAYYEATRLPVLAWSPLGSGFFSSPSRASSTYTSPANLAARERAESLASARGVTVAQIALAYLFALPFPVHPVVAASTADRMKANLDATKIALTPLEMDGLEGGRR